MDSYGLHFWDWSRTLLDHAVGYLMADWKGGEVDLADTVILVASAEAGRRLKEALAVAAAQKHGAVTAPYIWAPEVALTWHMDRRGLVSRAQERLVWTAVLERISIDAFPALFPSPPSLERGDWAAGVAQTLTTLRHSVGASGMTFAEVAQKLSDHADADRWAELTLLESDFLDALAELRVVDALSIKAASAGQPVLPQGIRRVLMMAVADPPQLVRQWFHSLPEEVERHLFVYAPATHREKFDDFGTPLPEVWVDAPPPLPLKLEHLHLEQSPEQQAQRAVELVRQLASRGESVTAGVGDPALAAALVGRFAGEEVQVYDPAGREAKRHPLLELLRVWSEVVQTGAWRSVAALVRQEDVLRVLSAELSYHPDQILESLDDFYAVRLPATLELAVQLCDTAEKVVTDAAMAESQKPRKEFVPLGPLLDLIQTRTEPWSQGSLAAALRQLLEWLYGGREFHTEAEHDRDYAQLLGEALRLAEEVETASATLRRQAAPAALLPHVIRELESIGLSDPRGEVDLVLHGWLELLWEPAPGLVISGFNEEAVPGAVQVDPFLPDHVKERLGLACQRSRTARDAYLLATMAGQRVAHGALHLVLGHASSAGDILRPSSLLFACTDQDLPARVSHLFPASVSSEAAKEPPLSLGWKLSPPPRLIRLSSISPSLLKSYLRCPTRCYLDKFLRMNQVDVEQREMTVMDYGQMVHDVLMAFGRDTQVRDSFAEKMIAEYFQDTLSTLAQERWGSRPLLSTALQLESARQRLNHAARVQAALREDGWRIDSVETDVNKEAVLKLAGLPLKARVDRVDVHRDGRIRVLDYKTGEKRRIPQDAHLGSVAKKLQQSEDHSWKYLDGPRGGVKQWKDLQLPLYVWAWQQAQQTTSVEAGYFNLPAAVMETQVDVWEGLTGEVVELAVACAETATERITEGIFWPPTEDLRGDSYEELLLGDAAATLEGDSFLKGEGHE